MAFGASIAILGLLHIWQAPLFLRNRCPFTFAKRLTTPSSATCCGSPACSRYTISRRKNHRVLSIQIVALTLTTTFSTRRLVIDQRRVRISVIGSRCMTFQSWLGTELRTRSSTLGTLSWVSRYSWQTSKTTTFLSWCSCCIVGGCLVWIRFTSELLNTIIDLGGSGSRLFHNCLRCRPVIHSWW